MPADQIRIIEQAKFTYSPLRKTFQKQTKTIEEQGKKHRDAIVYQSKRLAPVTNKNDNYKDNCKKNIWRTRERFDEIK